MLSDFLRGTAEYRIKFENPEHFMNCIKRKVRILQFDISQENTVCIKCLYRDLREIERTAFKKSAEIVYMRQRGLPVVLRVLWKRAGLVFGFMLFLLSLYLSSLFVWEIRVEGNEKLGENEVKQMLTKVGFYEGVQKKKVDVRSIADSVLINEDAVSWIAINLDGTVAHVEIKEALPAVPVPKKQNVNLVASTNGIILRVDAHEGGTKISKGDVVTKGQLLVSAFVDKRTGGSMLRGARGFVWAETEREFRVVVPLETGNKKYTHNVHREHNVLFLGAAMTFKLPHKKTENRFDQSLQKSKLTIGKNIVLPITLITINKLEYTEYKSRRTQNMALEIARKTAHERLYEISPNFTLKSTDEEYFEEGAVLVYTCTFTGVENIAKELEFELS